MKLKTFTASFAVLAALSAAAAVFVSAAPGTTGSFTPTLNVGKFAQLNIDTTAVAISPTQADMDANNGMGLVSKANAFTMKVKTNSRAGASVSASVNPGATNPITAGDILLRSSAKGSEVKTEKPLASGSSTLVWQNSDRQSSWADVPMDLLVQNLWNYDPGVNYSSTIVFTIVAK